MPFKQSVPQIADYLAIIPDRMSAEGHCAMMSVGSSDKKSIRHNGLDQAEGSGTASNHMRPFRQAPALTIASFFPAATLHSEPTPLDKCRI